MTGAGSQRSGGNRLGATFLALLAAWTLLILGLVAWEYRRAFADARAGALIDARSAYEKDVAYRRWAAGHGGVYVPVDGSTPPNPHLAGVAERDIRTPSGRQLTLVNPAYMTRQVHEMEASRYGVKGHITSLRLLRPENAPDPWERRALESFEAGVREVAELGELEGEPALRMMRPMYVEAPCLKCHGQQGYRVGDVRGGISISTPWEPYRAAASRRFRGMAGVLALVWVLGFAGFLGAERRIRVQQDERWRAEQALRTLTAELERRVDERTAELRTANQELEAFTYSVAHDLRAPLRGVEGFLGILNEEYGGGLDDEGRRIIQVARRSATRMDALIADLLALSRVGRAPLERLPVDMRALAATVWMEVAPAEFRASCDFVLDPVPEALADPALIRQVWVNLVANAVKYSRPGAGRRIRIGSRETAAAVAWFVEDAGVGFDQEYAGKLFQPFQRLHGPEFEGCGIGLAIVRRIVDRHGGEVGATGRVGAGAQFHFTLPRARPGGPGSPAA